MPKEYIIILLVSFTASLISTPLFMRLALKLDVIDRPAGRKTHARPTPYLGGMAFHAAMTAALLYAGYGAPYLLADGGVLHDWLALYLGAACFHALGIIDDVYSLPAAPKFFAQAAVAGGMTAAGFTIPQMTSPFGGTLALGWMGGVLSVFWILTIVNAINFIDGMDGLAGGVVFFAALANLIVALDPLQHLICLVSLGVMGGVLGFLPYNFAPARIFMGDAGSLYLGALLAGSSLASNVKGATVMTLSLPLVILSIPLIDASLTVIRRGRRGGDFFTADREHIHHRLLRLGFSARQAVLYLYGLCFLFSMSAVLASKLPTRYAFIFILVFFAAVAWGYTVFRAFEHRVIRAEGEMGD